MDNKYRNIIDQLRNCIRDESLFNDNRHQGEILRLMNVLYSCEIKDHADFRIVSEILLEIYDEYPTKSFGYLVYMLHNAINLALKLNKIGPSIKTKITDIEDDPQLLEKVLSQLPKGRGVQLSEFIDFDFPIKDLEDFLSLAIKVIEQQSIIGINDSEDISSQLLLLFATRNVALKLKRIGDFYILCSTFLDNLQRSGKNQIGRDVCEELILCGFVDSSIAEVMYCCYRFNTTTMNSITALHFGLMGMLNLIKEDVLPNRLTKQFFITTAILFRNCHLYEPAIELINLGLKHLDFSKYDFQKIKHCYFSCLLFLRKEGLPSEVASHLDKYREDILYGGRAEMIPWLIALYNIQSTYKSEDIGYEECRNYAEYFEKYASTTLTEKHKKFHSEDIKALTDTLVDSITQ